MQLVAQEQYQLLDLIRRNRRLCHREATGEIDNLLGQLIPAEPEVDQTLAHGCVLGIHQTLLDQFQQPSDACFGLLMILAHLAQPITITVLAFERCAQIVVEQSDEMFGLQYLLRHLADHNAVQLIHRHAQTLSAA